VTEGSLNDEPTVLVVDDDPDLRRLVVLALHRRGFETRQAGSGEEALRLLENEVVDAVVMDIAMPGISGLEVIRTLRASTQTATLPILLMTGSGDQDTVLLALEAGADDFLAKPVRLEELVARVRAHLRISSAWTEHVETELRGRADVVRSLSGLTTSTDARDTAASLVAELGRSADYQYVAVMRMAERGRLDVLATYTANEGVERGGSLPTDRSRYLVSRLRDGPWVDIVGSPTPRERANVFWSADLELAAGAPLYAANRLVGLLVVGVASSDMASPVTRPSRLLAAVIDYANILSVVAGPSIASQGRQDETLARLKRVVSTRAFFPVFQPIVDLRTRAVVGFEALTRFTDGTPPDVRFAEATEFGLGLELEAATIDVALRAIRELGTEGMISVNASPELVLRPELLQPLLALTDRKVVLELTEHARIEDYPVLRSALATYAPQVSLSVDDAGAGYASLRHILELRPEYVKLDISIVRGIEDDQVRQALVSGLVYFAGHTQSFLVAEGIETEAEAAALVDLGILLGQGYLLGRPVPLA
jgi:EAL domain-containing protein (putative c-di-GMP-specific phosphodiesterase class I)/DNA-binding response OmpR family regulator